MTEIVTSKISFSTNGNIDVIDITKKVEEGVSNSGLKSGVVLIFVPGATAGLTTMEYEPGLISDFRKMFKEIVAESAKYSHDASQPRGNAPSHLRASLIGPSITVPFENGKLMLGTWQQIVFVDFDNRPRNREVVLKIIGEK